MNGDRLSTHNFPRNRAAEPVFGLAVPWLFLSVISSRTYFLFLFFFFFFYCLTFFLCLLPFAVIPNFPLSLRFCITDFKLVIDG